MRVAEFSSLISQFMVVNLVKATIWMIAGSKGGIGETFKMINIGWQSELSMTEEEMIGLGVVFAWVIIRSKVWPCLCVGK